MTHYIWKRSTSAEDVPPAHVVKGVPTELEPRTLCNTPMRGNWLLMSTPLVSVCETCVRVKEQNVHD